MKIINIKRKTIINGVMIIVFLLIIGVVTKSFGMQHYYNLDFTTGLVTASRLNVRSGPSTAYKIVATVNKNEYIRVFAGVGDWYIVQVEGDYVGAVSKQYVKPIYPNSSGSGTSTGQSSGGSTTTSSWNSDEIEVFNLINQQRASNGLSALSMDNEVQRVARIKAQDMVK